MTYKLMKLVDNEWYIWGTYDDPVRLAEAAFFLGQSGGIEAVKVEVVTE